MVKNHNPSNCQQFSLKKAHNLLFTTEKRFSLFDRNSTWKFQVFNVLFTAMKRAQQMFWILMFSIKTS